VKAKASSVQGTENATEETTKEKSEQEVTEAQLKDGSDKPEKKSVLDIGDTVSYDRYVRIVTSRRAFSSEKGLYTYYLNDGSGPYNRDELILVKSHSPKVVDAEETEKESATEFGLDSESQGTGEIEKPKPKEEVNKMFTVGQRVSTAKIAAIPITAVYPMSDGTYVYKLGTQEVLYHAKDLEPVLAYEDETHTIEFHLLGHQSCSLMVTCGKETHYFHLSDAQKLGSVLEQFLGKLNSRNKEKFYTKINSNSRKT
jgi:hypothetical protein